MKTRAQILVMGLLSIVPLFPKESGARLFAARLIGVKEEALPQVRPTGLIFTDKEDELRSFQSRCDIISNGRLMMSGQVVAPNDMRQITRSYGRLDLVSFQTARSSRRDYLLS
jgi:hypothetical protein